MWIWIRYISFKNFSWIWFLTKVQSLGNLMGSIFLYFLPLEARRLCYISNLFFKSLQKRHVSRIMQLPLWVLSARVVNNVLCHLQGVYYSPLTHSSRAGSILRKECSSYSWDIPLLWKGGCEIFAFESVPYIFRGLKDKSSLFKHFSVLCL